MLGFIVFRFLDFVDIFLVALLLYQLHKLIKGTVAINIFVAIVAIWLLWLLVKALNMQLLSAILGQFIGVGVIALIIVFQQEIRRFLLIVGTRYIQRKFKIESFFKSNIRPVSTVHLKTMVQACKNLSETKTGALIVFSPKNSLNTYVNTGEVIDSRISSRLLEALFFKNSPLHDGAVIIIGDKIKGAGCLLPISQSHELPLKYGMRHRSALGMSEETDAFIIIVSEETGKIAYAYHGYMHEIADEDMLLETLEKLISE